MADDDDLIPDDDAEAEAEAGTIEPEDTDDDPDAEAEVDGDQEDDDDVEAEAETADVEYGGVKYTVPKGLEKAILQEADYTKKTQGLADERRAHEEQVTANTQAEALRNEQFEQAAEIRAIDIQLSQYDAVNWQELMAQDQTTFQQLDFERRQLVDKRAKANQDLAYKSQEVSTAQRAMHAKAGEKARAELSAKFPDWNSDHEEKLAQYAISKGVPERQVRSTTNKATLELLYEAHKYREIQDKRAAVSKSKPKPKPALPVAKVTGRRERGRVDPDKMSVKDWTKWREKQIAKKQASA